MKYIKPSCVIAIILCLVISLSSAFAASAAILTFETQYDYDTVNKAWLTDLTVKESLSGISDMVTDLTLVANPAYPYTQTHESFEEDVKLACETYKLDEGSARAAYIYLFEIMNDNAAILGDDTDDADIKEYLIDKGIVYPDDTDADTLLMARVLYVVMNTGSLDSYLSNGQLPAGTALESAVVSFMSVLTGVDMNAIKEWTVVNDNLSLDEYILAISKYTLWMSGYDVSIDMSADEVFRLVALMTIRKQGITAPDDISFDEIKIRYLAAMLGTKYDVSCSSVDLQQAMEQDAVAFYILQLMGQDAQLSLRPESISYEDAFMTVAENTDRFDIEVGEFYADVFSYTTTLKYKRNSIWLYPTSYVCNDEKNAEMITITANGERIADGNFSEVKLNPSVESQVITIQCEYDYFGEQFSTTYYLTVKQGLLNPDSVLIEDPKLEDIISGGMEFDDTLYAESFIPNSSDLVGGILGSIGLGVGFGDLLDNFTSSSVGSSSITGSIGSFSPSVNVNDISADLSGILNSGFLTVLPSVGAVGSSSAGLKDTSITMSVNSMDLFSKAEHTDRTNTVLSGIGGLELYSVAESVGAALLAGGVVIGDVASPIISSAVNDMIFDDGETVVGATVSNDTAHGDTSNLAYVSALTERAVDVYSKGDANAASGVQLNDFLSHQASMTPDISVDIPAINNNSDSAASSGSSKYVILIAASLAVIAGVVLIVVSKQRQVTY